MLQSFRSAPPPCTAYCGASRRAIAFALPIGRALPWDSTARATLPVSHDGRRRMALAYLARSRDEGRAKAGYMELVIAAALEWQLPPDYIASLGRWLPKRPRGAGARERGEFAWT